MLTEQELDQASIELAKDLIEALQGILRVKHNLVMTEREIIIAGAIVALIAGVAIGNGKNR